MNVAKLRDLAHAWWAALSGTSYVPMSSIDGKALLTGLVSDLAQVLASEPFDPQPAARAGAAMVAARMTNPVVLASSAQVLGQLPDLLGRMGEDQCCVRLAALIGAFSQGYATALKQRTLHEQEDVRKAVMTARDQAETAMRASEARFRVVFQNAAVAIAVGDTQGRLVEANPALARMLGRTMEQLRGATVFDFFHPDDQPDIRERVYQRLTGAGGGTVRLEERFRRPDGSYGWVLLAVTLVAGTDDHYLLAIGEDITARRQMEAELYRQARHDPLTGLANRLLLRERLQAAIKVAGPGDRIGLCFLDLDGFKQVNDGYGHGVGDRLLAAIAARLQSAVPGSLVTRIGGDEFVAVIAPPAQTDAVVDVAQRMLTACAEPFQIDGHQLAVSASIGVVVPGLAGADPEGLLDAADAGLYRAKTGGRGRWAVHDVTSPAS